MFSSFAGITALVTFAIAVAVFAKTKSLGKVVGVVIAGGVVMVGSNSGTMQALGNTLGGVFTTALSSLGTLIGGQ